MESRLQVTQINKESTLKAGLRVHDIIESFNGMVIRSHADLGRAIEVAPDPKSVVVVYRGERKLALEVDSGPIGIVVSEPTDYTSKIEFIQRLDEMILTTAPWVEGYRIARTVDIVSAECAFGMNIFRDAFASITDFFGGRSEATQKILRDARKSCLYELRREAAELGANAVIGIDLDYSEFSGKDKSMLFLVATGTAVCIERA